MSIACTDELIVIFQRYIGTYLRKELFMLMRLNKVNISIKIIFSVQVENFYTHRRMCDEYLFQNFIFN